MESLSWRERLNNFKIPIGLSLIGLVLILGGVFSSGLTKSKPKSFPKESLVEGLKMMAVDVSGAVSKPGVYRLKDGSRIEDAVAAAGGFTQDVNQEYISKSLNMAQKLSDGSKVYVPAQGEEIAKPNINISGANISAKVNINTSSPAELENLPGIGPITAAKIISGRPYQGAEDLLSKKIIGKSLFDKIKDSILVY